jgi:hypothetical protein
MALNQAAGFFIVSPHSSRDSRGTGQADFKSAEFLR